MQPEPLPIDRAGLMDVLTDGDAMAAWECIRRMRHCSNAEVAGQTGRKLADARASIDRLVAAGLVVRRPASRGKRTETFAVAMPELRVALGGIAAADADTIVARWEGAVQQRFERITRSRTGTRRDSDRRFFGMEWAYLGPEDKLRVSGLVRELCAVFMAAKERHAAAHPDGSAPPDPAHEPYAFLLRLLPVTAPEPPMPSIIFRRLPADEEAARQRAGADRSSLSAREREIALALANGESRPAVAKRLGLSPYTVVSLARRVYGKLGVRSRAELARAMAPQM